MKTQIIQYLTDQLESDKCAGYKDTSTQGIRNLMCIGNALFGPGYEMNALKLKEVCDELEKDGLLTSGMVYSLRWYRVNEVKNEAE